MMYKSVRSCNVKIHQ